MTPVQETAIRQINEIIHVMSKHAKLFLGVVVGDSVLIELLVEVPATGRELLDERGRVTASIKGSPYTGRVPIVRHGPFTFREADEILDVFHSRPDVEVVA